MIKDEVRARWRATRHAVAISPTKRLALVTAATAPLWLLGALPGGALVPGIVVVALLLAAGIDVVMLPNRNDLEVRRAFPGTVGVGDRADGEYVVTSRWSRPLMATLFDALPARHLSDARPFAERLLPAFGSLRLEFGVVGASRGHASLGDVAIRVRTMMGLVARTARYSQDDAVLVAPSLAGVTRFRWLAVHHRLAAVGVRSTHRRGEGQGFARLRDYVAGDDPRHIDWKGTARRRHLITREFTVEQSQTVFVLLDAGRSMTQLAGRYPRFEYALSAALLLADVAISAGDRVGAMVFDDQLRVLVPAQRGVPALQALRSALMPLQPTLVEPDYAAAFRALSERQRKRALIVLVTDVLDPRAARALLAHLTKGASRHLALVVALRNDALLAAATPASTSTSDLYVSAAAEELLADRRTALQRMRDAGVVVLDVAPDAMAAAVVNQYLDLKARGAL